jgi:hypothetical protein
MWASAKREAKQIDLASADASWRGQGDQYPTAREMLVLVGCGLEMGTKSTKGLGKNPDRLRIGKQCDPRERLVVLHGGNLMADGQQYHLSL